MFDNSCDCLPNFEYKHESCVAMEPCGEGQYRDEWGSCQQCNDSCETCTGPDDHSCLTCKGSLILQVNWDSLISDSAPPPESYDGYDTLTDSNKF
mmetsp:Transcript_26633/g.4729  ORF Transcript_26633/g.4729 Transcript_26633/m.4729 type:complete len:95 (+) Transcript_26633:208-492(+)